MNEENQITPQPEQEEVKIEEKHSSKTLTLSLSVLLVVALLIGGYFIYSQRTGNSPDDTPEDYYSNLLDPDSSILDSLPEELKDEYNKYINAFQEILDGRDIFDLSSEDAEKLEKLSEDFSKTFSEKAGEIGLYDTEITIVEGSVDRCDDIHKQEEKDACLYFNVNLSEECLLIEDPGLRNECIYLKAEILSDCSLIEGDGLLKEDCFDFLEGYKDNHNQSYINDDIRISDIKQLQLALELYFEQHEAYPIDITTATLVTSGYIASIPTDPVTKTSYPYIQLNHGDAYLLKAVLDNKNNELFENDIDGVVEGIDCSDFSRSYCVIEIKLN